MCKAILCTAATGRYLNGSICHCCNKEGHINGNDGPLLLGEKEYLASHNCSFGAPWPSNQLGFLTHESVKTMRKTKHVFLSVASRDNENQLRLDCDDSPSLDWMTLGFYFGFSDVKPRLPLNLQPRENPVIVHRVVIKWSNHGHTLKSARGPRRCHSPFRASVSWLVKGVYFSRGASDTRWSRGLRRRYWSTSSKWCDWILSSQSQVLPCLQLSQRQIIVTKYIQIHLSW